MWAGRHGRTTSVMRTSPTRQPHPHFAAGGVFLEALASHDFRKLAPALDADAAMSALLPGGLREWVGAAEICTAFERWFGEVDRFEVAEASIGQIGSLLALQWRIRLSAERLGDAVMVVEQHAYAATGPSGRIRRISLLCSGFWNDHSESDQPRKEPCMSTTTDIVDNGVNTEALIAARDALRQTPEAGDFTWRASCTWVHGTYSQTTVEGFRGLGQEHRHRKASTFDIDHPEVFASEDRGPTPVEHVLGALAGCLTAGVAAVAQLRDIQLRSVTSTLEGEMNVLGILGGDPDVRNGFSAVTVRFDIDADTTREEIEAIVAQSQKRSAVFDIITNPTNVTVQVA
jgi:uncharacterized OsmC-like protein